MGAKYLQLQSSAKSKVSSALLQSLFNASKSNHQRCSVKIDVLRNFAKLTGKHLRQSLFFIKVSGLRHFPESFVKFLRISFYTEHLWWLLFLRLSLYILLLPSRTTLEILWVLLSRAPNSTQLYPPLPGSIHIHAAPPSSIYLHPAHFNLHPCPSTSPQLILAST